MVHPRKAGSFPDAGVSQMDWTRLSEKTNVFAFVIMAVTSAVGLYNWLTFPAPAIAVSAVTSAPIAATYPKLPIILTCALIVSLVFTGITHLMARRSKRHQPSSDQT